jgi:hypothetical protein
MPEKDNFRGCETWLIWHFDRPTSAQNKMNGQHCNRVLAITRVSSLAGYFYTHRSQQIKLSITMAKILTE